MNHEIFILLTNCVIIGFNWILNTKLLICPFFSLYILVLCVKTTTHNFSNPFFSLFYFSFVILNCYLFTRIFKKMPSKYNSICEISEITPSKDS
jgi:hypothetical protein